MQQHLPLFLNIAAHGLSNADEMLTGETVETLAQCLSWLNTNHADDVGAAVAQMDSIAAACLESMAQSAGSSRGAAAE